MRKVEDTKVVNQKL